MEYKIKTLIDKEKRIPVTEEFIAKNKLTLKRIKDEIAAKCSFSGPLDFKEMLLEYLPFETVKGFLKKEYIEKVEKGKEKWDQITDIKEAVQDFLDYMVFAWGKAEDERGLSAGRSISKLSTWMWLLGREDLSDILQDGDMYNPYGAPALIECCKKLEIKVPDSLVEFAKNKV